MSNVQLKIWCQAAKMSADERVLTFLEKKIQDNEALLELGVIRETYIELSRILEISPAFLERIEQWEEKLRNQRPQERTGIELELRCPACGEVNDYMVDTLVVTMGFHLDHPLIGGDIRCSFCGVREQFQITQSGFGKYIEEFGRVSALMAADKEFESAIQFVEPFLVKGSRLSIPQAMKYFKEKVRENPRSPRHQLYLGHIYQKTRIYSGALDHFTRTIALDPTNIEAPFFLAMVLEDLGRSEEAFEVLYSIHSYIGRYSYYIFKKRDRKELGESIAGLHNWLRRKIGVSYVGDLPDDFLMHQKFGANDKCPCGSGKKYKKCCMKKAIY